MSQHMEALARANDFRLKRAALKREINAGETRASDVLDCEEVPDCLKNMLAEQVICALPRMPAKLARRMIEETSRLSVPTNPSRTLGQLTFRQRRVLAIQVRQWEDRRAVRLRRREVGSR